MSVKADQIRTAILNVLNTAPDGKLPWGQVAAAVEAAGVPEGKGTSGSLRDLADRGCVTSPARGVWAITDTGRTVAGGGTLPDRPAQAKEPKPATDTPATDTPEQAKVDTGDGTTAPETPAAPATEPKPKRVKVAATTAPETSTAPASTNPVVVPEWLKDDGLRGMVIETSDCFGAYSAKAQPCGECPLAGWCRNMKASTLTLLASKLQTAKPEAPEPVSKAAAKLDAAVSTANTPTAPRAPAKPEGSVMRAPQDTTCAKSGKAITKGDKVVYVRGLGIVRADEIGDATPSA